MGAAPSILAEGAAFLLQGGTNRPPLPHSHTLASNFPLMSARWRWRVIISHDYTFPGHCVCPRSHCWKQAARLRPNLFYPSRNLLFSAAKTKQKCEEVTLPLPKGQACPLISPPLPALLQLQSMGHAACCRADDVTAGLWTAISLCAARASSPRGKQFRR